MNQRIYWTNFFTDLLSTFRYYYCANKCFVTSAIRSIFSDFCYIIKFWNSNRFKLLAFSVCCMCKLSLKDSCKLHGSSVQGLYALCYMLIRRVRVAGNMNSTEWMFKKCCKKNIRDILFYPSLLRVTNRDI